MRHPQLNEHGELRHLLTIEGLPRDVVTHILDTASSFLEVSDRAVKKVPLLRGKSVFNLFFENSTRTRTTFEIAATRLSADVVNLDVRTSSTSKGESLLDTIDNLAAMNADMFVVRHAQSGAPYMIAQHVGPGLHVINAGDGRHAHRNTEGDLRQDHRLRAIGHRRLDLHPTIHRARMHHDRIGLGQRQLFFGQAVVLEILL